MAGSQRHSNPHIDHAKRFPHDVENIRRRAPPVHRVERIIRWGAHNDASGTIGVVFPESVNTTCVRFRCHDNHDGGLFFFGFGCDRMHFIDGVADGGRECVDIGWRDTSTLEDARIESVFAGDVDVECCKRRGGLVWMCEPDLLSPAGLTEARGFERSHRHAAAENDDRVGFFERILDNKPATDAKEQHRDTSARDE